MYGSGVAGNFDALISAISGVCQSAGWSSSGGFIGKGDCAVRLVNKGDAYIEALVGTGYVGTTLTNPAPGVLRLREATRVQSIVFPVNYYVHAFDHEVYAIIRYAGDRYCYLAFGYSPVAGLPSTGTWAIATGGDGISCPFLQYDQVANYLAGIETSYNSVGSTGPFWVSRANGDGAQAYVRHNLDVPTSGNANPEWSPKKNDTWADFNSNRPPDTWAPFFIPSCPGSAADLFVNSQPNTWNQEAVLAPIQPLIHRPQAKCSIIIDLEHARYVRLDNLNAEQVITIGPDKWRVYPFYRRNASQRNPSQSDHTGTLGWAIRYDGA